MTSSAPDSGPPHYLLGLDVGTLGVKGVLVDLDGQVLAHHGLEHEVIQPRLGWAEQDADRHWWGDGVAVIRALLAGSAIDPSAIAAVGVCGLVPCLCPLDAHGWPLRPAILYADNRALSELERANQLLTAVVASPGYPALTAQAVLPKLMWLRDHEPETFSLTRAVLSAHNYVIYRLTGEMAVDHDTASIFGAVFDPVTSSWREDVCTSLGLPVAILPPPVPATHIVGGVSAAAARETGLAPATPVIAGSGDTFPTIVGAGAVEPGAALISIGTTGLFLLVERPLEEVAATIHFGGEPPAIRWLANVLTCGRAVHWFRDRFAPELSYAELDDLAAVVPPGSDGLVALPHLAGRRQPEPNPQATAAFVGLTLAHTPAHLYRALLESFAFAVRQGLPPERLRSTAAGRAPAGPAPPVSAEGRPLVGSGRPDPRQPVHRVVATAGGARSSLWRQILADVLDRPVEYAPQASAALGVAYLAGYALGLFPDLSAIRDQWLCGLAARSSPTVPQPETRALYDSRFVAYCRLDATLGNWAARQEHQDLGGLPDPRNLHIKYYNIVADFLGRKEEQRSVEAGSAVRGLLQALAAESSPFRRLALHPDGAISGHIRVFRNGQPVLDWDTPLADGDQLLVFPAISGGV